MQKPEVTRLVVFVIRLNKIMYGEQKFQKEVSILKKLLYILVVIAIIAVYLFTSGGVNFETITSFIGWVVFGLG
ncbi:hypothetical protein [Carboxydothermus pertinax]|uniref:Uncharacterized protein n=1 Tax=Carboxydothermus pertinax TaxID=870242 RepID=A0A1L8CRL4_9THEO|nr:hypothetical protein [Carboxydothermus pertinax]GAV21566.1 hypothetical protein cpu_00760 [Carboxydothermus pertinax]